jgi:hypothetical protein
VCVSKVKQGNSLPKQAFLWLARNLRELGTPKERHHLPFSALGRQFHFKYVAQCCEFCKVPVPDLNLQQTENSLM